MIELKGRELSEALCQALEPEPSPSGECIRVQFGWVKYSKLGWWKWDQDFRFSPTNVPRWEPIDLTGEISLAWRVIAEMKKLGFLLRILEMADGWVVDASKYDITFGWPNAKMIDHMWGQRCGEDAPTAICRAALAALQVKP